MKKILLGILAATVVGLGGAYVLGVVPAKAPVVSTAAPAAQSSSDPAVLVVKLERAEFVETVLVTGSVVARDEVLVAPEIEGFRILELLADEGDTVKAGQVLARLSNETLQAQLAQNDANLARADAAIAVASSTIVQAEATAKEASNAFERAKPLAKSGYLSDALFDQRQSAANTAQSKLVAARDGLVSAQADKTSLEAQRRELMWKFNRTEVRSPVEGLVSRRPARLGSVASAVSEPMFRIIARAEVELDAEMSESDVGKVRVGQKATVNVTGAGEVTGTVRLISSEVDRTTRLGKVKVFFGVNPQLRLGAFARGTIETGRSHGLSAPTSAVVYGADGVTLQAVIEGRIETHRVKTGLKTQMAIEIVEGAKEGDTIVAKSGSFLRNGDAVRPLFAETKVSGVAR